MRKGFTQPLILICFLIALSIIGAVLYFQYQPKPQIEPPKTQNQTDKTPPPKALSSIDASPSSKPDCSSTTTKTYTSTLFHYSVAYPLCWSFTHNGSTDNGLNGTYFPMENVQWNGNDWNRQPTNGLPVFTIFGNFQGDFFSCIVDTPTCKTQNIVISGVKGVRYASPGSQTNKYVRFNYYFKFADGNWIVIFSDSDSDKWVKTLTFSDSVK